VPPTPLARADDVTEYRFFDALRSVAIGTKRTYRNNLLFVRFRGEADMHRCHGRIASGAHDPKRTSGLIQNNSGLPQRFAGPSAAG
jgi:hypothetical protein